MHRSTLRSLFVGLLVVGMTSAAAIGQGTPGGGTPGGPPSFPPGGPVGGGPGPGARAAIAKIIADGKKAGLTNDQIKQKIRDYLKK